MVAAYLEDRTRFGSLKIDANHKVLGFEEKGAATGPGFINAGYYIFKRSLLDLIPEGKVCSLERDIFPRLVEQNAMYAFENHGDFIDIGLPEEWQRAGDVLPKLS